MLRSIKPTQLTPLSSQKTDALIKMCTGSYVRFRSFISTQKGDESAVSCPASKEAGFKSNCASCGLCSGMLGRGKTNIKILEH